MARWGDVDTGFAQLGVCGNLLPVGKRQRADEGKHPVLHRHRVPQRKPWCAGYHGEKVGNAVQYHQYVLRVLQYSWDGY